jgi:hypothetical protein
MLQELIHKARRRLLFNEVLKQFALSAALAIGGLALLLIVGTRYLQWWVVAFFAVGVSAWAYVKLRRKLPSDYSAAVWLDDKAGLHDSLSTAHYFAVRKPGAMSAEAEAILLAQRGQAESVAGDVNVSVAVPFRFPRALYGLAALLFVSSGLVTVRYFFGHTLDLTAPLTEVIFQDLAAVRPPAKGAKPAQDEKDKDQEEARSLLSKLGLGANLDPKENDRLDEALADALKSAEKSPGNGENAKLDDKMKDGDPMDEAPKDAPKNGNAEGGDNKQKTSEKGDSSGNQSGAKSAEKADKSLLSKLKDAMENMMGSPNPDGNQASDSKKNQQSKANQGQAGQQPGESGDEENKTGAADGEAEGNAQKGNSPGQTSGNTGAQQEGPSVAGSEDGVKAIKAAAQLKAMGKISELIGKRSEQVTGESMIEVQSGNQKLQTAYKDKAATHGEGTGEVSRDEIPLSVQAYVQEYFQQVRKPDSYVSKAPAPKAPAAKPKAPAAKNTSAPAKP